MSENDNTSTPIPAVPTAVPLGSSQDRASAQVGWARGQLGAPNTPAHAEPERPGRPHSKRAGTGRSNARIGAVQLERISEGLSDRDRQILTELAAHGYLSTKHIEGLSFAGHTPVTAERLSRRAMSRLDRLGLAQAIQRRVGGVRAGSSATVWQLSGPGRRLVATISTAKRPHEPSPRLLAHSLAVADVRLTIADLPTTTESIPSVDVQIESAAWRRYTGLGGDRRILQPDLAATLHGVDADGPYEDRWFIEVDCGTESIPTLLKKCRQYDDYRLSGSEQTTHGVFPRVLWVMGGPRADHRIDDLRRRLERTSYPPGMFTVTTAEEVQATIGGAL